MVSHVEFSLKRFPISAKLKDECGLPFSCIIQPFGRADQGSTDEPLINSTQLPRCGECYSYINGYCMFDGSGWDCSLCGSHNFYKGAAHKRYTADTRHTLPELCSNSFSVVVNDFNETPGSNNGLMHQVPVVGHVAPVCMALVDTCCEDDALELVRSALLAALEALPPCTRFGLVTVSNQISLYDVRGPAPVLRSVPLMGPDGVLAASLEEVLPLEAQLAPVGSCKEAIAAAIEQLEPDASYARTATQASTQAGPTPPQQEGDMQRHLNGCRGFGRALQVVLEYLKGRVPLPEQDYGSPPATPTAAAPALGPAHLLAFLSGPPDLGPGLLARPSAALPHPSRTVEVPGGPSKAVDLAAEALAGYEVVDAPAVHRGMSDPEAWQAVEEARLFYQQAAVAAASLAVTIDLLAVGPRAVGLHLMAPLVASTGGCLFLYPSHDDCALPQDVYRRLATPRALSGLLRVRTCPELRVSRIYGRAFPDPTHPALHHTPCAAPSDSFAFDLDFTSAAGFAAPDAAPPTIQVAFQYSTLVQVPPPEPKEGDATPADTPPPAPLFVMQRRMVVTTLRLYTAQTPQEVYRGTNPDAVMAMLCHKICKAINAAAQAMGGPLTASGWGAGVDEGRLLLRDWLVIFTADYHRHLHAGLGSLQAIAQAPVDMAFPQCEALQAIPRLVYAMLRAPLLSPEPPPSDLSAFIGHLWATLPPADLLRAIYPALSSYSDPDTPDMPRHALSRAALQGAPGPIFLLDAYILLICLYSSRCPPGTPFPPPQQSVLRKTIAQIRQERRLTPQLHIVQEGDPAARLFDQLLLDEGAGGEPSETGYGSLAEFIKRVRAEVQAHLLAEASGRHEY